MKKNKGFTLIELLAVIVILGILLSVSIVAVNNIRKKQNVENKLNIISSIMTGAKNYIADNPSFWNCTYTGNTSTQSCYSENPKDGIWLNMEQIIKYADFDTEKYPELYYGDVDNTDEVRSAIVKQCENGLKYEVIYLYREAGNNSYEEDYSLTDCGCEEQQQSDHGFKFCDSKKSGAGWDLNGKYYDEKGNSDSSKDIKFEK